MDVQLFASLYDMSLWVYCVLSEMKAHVIDNGWVDPMVICRAG